MSKKLTNPIITGFNPDPVIFRDDEKYYIVVSTFEWLPGIRVYSSTNLYEWHYETSILTDSTLINLRGNPRGGSIWGPFATYHNGKYYVVYTNTNSTTVPYKDVDNYIIWADNIHGPWSQPTYINSSGFDPSIFFDTDGKAYFLNEIWDYRIPSRNKSCGIVMQEIDPISFCLLGRPKLIFKGTEAKKTEAPQIYKHGNFYYLLVAEGGTEQNHQETVARSKNVWGPYEVDPQTPLITAKDSKESVLQSTGHSSLVPSKNGDWYIAYLCTRPLYADKAILGRETALQQVNWTDDGWLRLSNGSHRPDLYLPNHLEIDPAFRRSHSFTDPLNNGITPKYWNTLRQFLNSSWVVSDSTGLTIKGGQSPQSNFDQHLIATRQCDFKATVSVEMDYTADTYLQLAGITLYLDTQNYLLFMVTVTDQGLPCVTLQKSEKGNFSIIKNVLINRQSHFKFKIELNYEKASLILYAEQNKIDLGQQDISFLSGGFTGNFIGLDVIDMYQRNSSYAHFSNFSYMDHDHE